MATNAGVPELLHLFRKNMLRFYNCALRKIESGGFKR